MLLSHSLSFPRRCQHCNPFPTSKTTQSSKVDDVTLSYKISDTYYDCLIDNNGAEPSSKGKHRSEHRKKWLGGGSSVSESSADSRFLLLSSFFGVRPVIVPRGSDCLHLFLEGIWMEVVCLYSVGGYGNRLPSRCKVSFCLSLARSLALWASISSRPFCNVLTNLLSGNNRRFCLVFESSGMRCPSLEGTSSIVDKSINLLGEKAPLFKIHCLSPSLYHKCPGSLKLPTRRILLDRYHWSI